MTRAADEFHVGNLYFNRKSTGAMVAASLIVLGRLDGVDRPAIGTIIPTVKGRLLLLDAGANVQCTAEHLLSFAKLGQVFATYPDVLPEEFADVLGRLHFEAPPMHFSLLREQFRRELGAAVGQRFLDQVVRQQPLHGGGVAGTAAGTAFRTRPQDRDQASLRE